MGPSGSFPLVDTYVAMQGAFSAGAYGDDDTDAHIPLPPWIPEPPTWDTDLYHYWSSGATNPDDPAYMTNTFDKAHKWVNMYNPDDAATSSAWPANNLVEELVGTPIWPYGYSEDASLVPPFGENEYVRRVTGAPDVELASGLTDANGNPGEHAYEILAFMGQSNAMPIGTKEVNEWFGVNSNLDTLGLVDDDPARPHLAPDLRKNHSFQFHHDAVVTWPFWLHIKQQTTFQGTY